MKSRLNRLNGWQRLWLSVSGACLPAVLGWPHFLFQEDDKITQEISRAVSIDVINPKCIQYLKLPLNKLAEPQHSVTDSNCWNVWNFRKYRAEDSLPLTLEMSIREGTSRQYPIRASIGVGLVIFGSFIAYVIGATIAWIRRGFAI